MTQLEHPYDALTPDFVLDAIESIGLISDQRILALNSYENRVYQVGIEDDLPLIAKFYRPERWSDEAILEEHHFTQLLCEQDIAVVPPLSFEGRSLHTFKGFRFALFRRQGGYAPEIDQPDTLFRLGRNIGRLHQVGSIEPFQHRPSFSVEQWGLNSREFLLNHDFIPSSLLEAYGTLSQDLLSKMQQIFTSCHYPEIRLHGDCHLGNILWRDDLAYFVDFDDCINGPAIQDIWLLLSGDAHQQSAQLMEFIEGYEEFYEFDASQLRLIESLRTLRMMNYAAWLAKRWSDPAFPMHFPWFNTERYWSQHILELREQLAMLDEPPLKITPY